MPKYLKTFKGIVYRSHDPKWAYEPTSGKGAEITGGRFNPKGIPALYTSLSQMGALLELQQGFTAKAPPQLICSYSVETQGVVDLTDLDVLRHYGVNPLKFDCAWMDDDNPYTHQVHKHLVNQGISAIIVPSFAKGADGCKNLIFWKWSNKLPHKIIVFDDEHRLPKNQLSWQ